MQDNAIEFNFLLLFTLISFFVFLIIKKYSHVISNGFLLDSDFKKPQAFHNKAVSRSGGLASIISLTLYFIMHYLLFAEILYTYLVLGIGLFVLGFLDDLKINISPFLRLLLMMMIIIITINFFSIEIDRIDLNVLNIWIQNKLFLNVFLLLCFLFIINGANLIDGFNGLAGINLLIVNTTLLFINLNNGYFDFSIFLVAQIITLGLFLLFNFPHAQIFFGDSGSYLFGGITALNVINTNNMNPLISSFFFCILLFYLFNEVFFSFLRKIFLGKSPLKPDNIHLHMLSYSLLKNKFKVKNSNYKNSLLINLIFSILVLPSVFFKNNGLICKYWFFSLLIMYSLIYLRLYSLTKK